MIRVILSFACFGFIQAKLMEITCPIIKDLVDGHNGKRLQAAEHKIPGYPGAINMTYMHFLLVLTLVASSWADLVPTDLVIEPPIRVDLQPPEEYSTRPSAREVFQAWIPMPYDHFDPQNNATFLMRYMFNEEFFGGDGSPVFIMVGGEWAISTGWLLGGNMYEMARENHGHMIYTEHRYYGATLPYTDFTTENLRFLNVDQALADLAYFILDLKKQPRFAESEVILYGGSYAANMALWFKQRYPHLVKGVVASSGPIKAEIDFAGYLEVVHEAYRSEGGDTCIGTVTQGIADTIVAMQTAAGRQTLEQAYRLCGPMDYDNRLEMGYFSGMISWSFSGSVQQAQPGTIISICNLFAGDTFGVTPMQKVGGFIAWYYGLGENSCWSLTFQGLVNSYSANGNSRAWYYQTCTEYGYFQTAPRSGTAFDPLEWLDTNFYVEICKRAFSERFDEDFVRKAIDRVNEVFGGLEPNVDNTVNIHGTIDPWHALGVHDTDLKESSPTYLVPRASHCFDMRQWLTTDTIRMMQAQQAARRIVKEWLSS